MINIYRQRPLLGVKMKLGQDCRKLGVGNNRDVVERILIYISGFIPWDKRSHYYTYSLRKRGKFFL